MDNPVDMIVDTGAETHTVNDITLFTDFTDLNQQLSMANGGYTATKGCGTVRLGAVNDRGNHAIVTFRDVPLLDECGENLLDVDRLLAEGFDNPDL